jgi:hypothetical protein
MSVTENAFDRLVGLLRRPQQSVIAMVGAGISVGVGYPTWNGLLDMLHDKLMSIPQSPDVMRRGLLPTPKYIMQLKTSGDLTWRAQEYRRLLGPNGFNSVIWETFRPKETSGASEPDASTVLGELYGLNFRHVLTTNYDPSLENELCKAKQKWTVLEWTERDKVRDFIRDLSNPNGNRYLVYVHGTYDNPDSIVLTERDYIERYVVNEEANRKLLAIFMTQPVVFIGFSMADPALEYVLRMVNAHMRPTFVDGELKQVTAQHFAILPLRAEQDADAETNRFKSKYGIEPIFYELKTRDAKHEQLLPLLRSLRMAVASEAAHKAGREQEEATRIERKKLAATSSKRRKVDPLDPHKGRWGGEPQRNNRLLSAEVVATGNPDWFLVRLRVESTDTKRRPLKGKVMFHLHPSFTPAKVPVSVKNGVASLDRYAYGAFTVGATTDNNQIKLELDLSELPSAPTKFRER